jgi:hypothetical protein
MRHTMSLAILSWILIGVASCAQTEVRKEPLPTNTKLNDATRERNELFRENLASYEAKTPDEEQILAKLGQYKSGYENFNLQQIAQILSTDFELLYYRENDVVQTQNLDTFLQKRSRWRPKGSPDRKLLISIKGADYNAKTGTFAVTALTTYKSKYFHPRFVEVFLFGKSGIEWRLRRVMMYPNLPARPDQYEVGIFIGPYLKNRLNLQGLETEMVAEGPDIIEKYVQLVGGPPGTPRMHNPIVILFPEPPPEGAVIKVVQVAAETYGNEVRVARNGNPYFFLVGSGFWGYGWVRVTVMMNGVQIVVQRIQLG